MKWRYTGNNFYFPFSCNANFKTFYMRRRRYLEGWVRQIIGQNNESMPHKLAPFF